MSCFLLSCLNQASLMLNEKNQLRTSCHLHLIKISVSQTSFLRQGVAREYLGVSCECPIASSLQVYRFAVWVQKSRSIMTVKALPLQLSFCDFDEKRLYWACKQSLLSVAIAKIIGMFFFPDNESNTEMLSKAFN